MPETRAPGRPAQADLQLLQSPQGRASTTDPEERAEAVRGIGPLRVSVVIPTLNEAANLPHVLPRIPDWVHEVILVDGHSTDATVEVARRLWPGIRIVSQEGRGKGDALRTGFAVATGHVIVMLDADGSTNPSEIPIFVGALAAGAHFVKGSRFIQGGGTADITLHRALGNKGFVGMVRLLFGGHYTDLCYGYNAFWSWAVPLLQLDADGFEIETLMNIRALQLGLRVVEVPSFEAQRVHGTSRLRTISDGWRVLKTIWRERSRAGLVPSRAPHTLRNAHRIDSVGAKTHVAAVGPILSQISLRADDDLAHGGGEQ